MFEFIQGQTRSTILRLKFNLEIKRSVAQVKIGKRSDLSQSNSDLSKII